VEALALGLSIGLAAGISPGPLLFLVVTSALRSGARAGVAAACAPLLSDALVVATTLFVLGRLPERTLAVVGLAGGLVVLGMGLATVRDARRAPDLAGQAGDGGHAAALRRAVVVNLLSPHPWLTWATALGPLVVSTWRGSPAGGVALVAGFYATLVGAKTVVALLVAGTRHRLGETGYRRALAGSGWLLALAGAALFAEFLPRVLSS
jgi:threonine/homoserine/homoserine lactone efflux protein